MSFQISNYYMFEYDSSAPGVVKTLHDIDGITVNTFRLASLAGRVPSLPSEKSYNDEHPVAINAKKIQDISKLLAVCSWWPHDIL